MEPSPIKVNQLKNIIFHTQLEIEKLERDIQDLENEQMELVHSLSPSMDYNATAKVEHDLEGVHIQMDNKRNLLRRARNRKKHEEKSLSDYLKSCEE